MASGKLDMEADIQADKNAVRDDGEDISLMEPTQLGEGFPGRDVTTELAFELAKRSAGFKRSLPAPIFDSLATLVRAMNCYYSNLIEGHNTHPVEIERALNDDYSADAEKRDLQLEAKAHIEVQRWIDEGGLRGRAATIEGVRETHGRFYAAMPEELRWAEYPDGRRVPVVPGEYRDLDVQVGRHRAISPGAVPRFMARFEAVYSRLNANETTVATAAAHHRLAWIHPFMDGNGRVGRLMSHALLLESVDSGGVWSVSRGLARNVEAYKTQLASCDQPRRGDRDGRGALSHAALASFTEFFLKTCIDQVDFMESLIEPERLRKRIEIWIEEEAKLGHLNPKVGAIVGAILYRGELPRGEVSDLLGAMTDRHSRRLLEPLTKSGVLLAESTRAPLRLGFPAALAGRWMPGLFPEQV
jgi:Fic family protein